MLVDANSILGLKNVLTHIDGNNFQPFGVRNFYAFVFWNTMYNDNYMCI